MIIVRRTVGENGFSSGAYDATRVFVCIALAMT